MSVYRNALMQAGSPTRTATGQEGLQQSFTNIANQLSGREPSGLDP